MDSKVFGLFYINYSNNLNIFYKMKKILKFINDV